MENNSQSETPIGNIFASGRDPVFAFVFDNCRVNYLRDKQLFAANITLCGYDYFILAKNEMDAKLDLCNMMMKSKYIQNSFKK